MTRKLLSLSLLFLVLFGVAWWAISPQSTIDPARCEGLPVLVSYQKREALFCLSSPQPSQLISAASITGSCKEELLSSPPLENAEHIKLIEEDGVCQIERGRIPATQRFMLGLSLDLNTATAEELETLPGLGPSVANAIVEDRQTNGPFQSIEDLDRVKGVGPKLLEKLRPFISVSIK